MFPPITEWRAAHPELLLECTEDLDPDVLCGGTSVTFAEAVHPVAGTLGDRSSKLADDDPGRCHLPLPFEVADHGRAGRCREQRGRPAPSLLIGSGFS